ncbi:GDP-L-fucose synthase family protein [Mycolicibacterium wolinskyi]|uniref:GDP-L-fucose synthase family protein n=1 Tax=Mycolicibacterium wolinskyi TaxID=59750 RepID=UPI000A00BC7A|nr:GDP-L-fucose synthase [Mycolicibacterium wolinskyi]
MADVHPVDRGSRIYVAGHRGLAGSAIKRAFEAAGFTDIVGVGSDELDLRDRDATFDYIGSVMPDVIVLAAAKVGGIVANNAYPAEFLSDNVRIQVNVMDAARDVKVRRLVFLGSSCIYPKHAPQPIQESALLSGALEPTNDAYAVAKIAGITHLRAVRREYGLNWIAAMPTNLYGPGDNFDPENSHVLPGMIYRFHHAVQQNEDTVVLWGSGRPRREFLHADDLGRAVVQLLDCYDGPDIINVGTGQDLTIRELAHHVAQVVGFSGEIVWDTQRPDGTYQKLLDVSRISALGWAPRVALSDGIRDAYEWFRANVATTRVGH